MNNLDRYKKISESERETGCFSSSTVRSHQKALVSEFLQERRAIVKKRTINFIGSFLCVCAVILGVTIAAGEHIQLSMPIINLMISTWTVAYFASLFVTFGQYPTLKRAELHLQIIHAVHVEMTENHRFEA